MNKTVRYAAFFTVSLMLSALLCSCSVKEDTNPVIMDVDGLEITKFDFDMSYANNEYYYHLVYGAISQEEYFNRVMNDLTKYAVAAARAERLGITLTEDDEAEIAEEVQEQCDYLFDQYRERASAVVGEDGDIDAEARKLYELDMGYSFDEYRRLYETSLRRGKEAHKLYEQTVADVTPDETQIRKYMESLVISQSRMDFGEFSEKYNSFIRGEGDVPFFVPDDCFTVNNLFIAYENTGTDDAPVYDTAMADLKSENVDSMLELGVSTEGFGKLVRSMGDDALMKDDTCFDWGYLIHESLDGNYEKGFVYAALELAGVNKRPSNDLSRPDEIKYFTTSDGEQIARFRTEKGINYMILNRKFMKGDMPYENGDEVWNLAYEGAYEAACDEMYDGEYEKWFAEAKINYYFERFKSEYVPEDTNLPR